VGHVKFQEVKKVIFLIGFVKNLISGKNMNIDGNEQELK